MQHPLISWLDSLLIHHSERTVKELFIHRKFSSSSFLYILGTHKKQTNKRKLIVYSSEKTKTFLSFTVFFLFFLLIT